MNDEMQGMFGDLRLSRPLSRRRVLRLGGMVAVGAVALPPLLAACGGDDNAASSSPAAGATTGSTPPPAPTVGNPQIAGGATEAIGSVINIKAHEVGNLMVFDVDKLAVAAGKATFNFTPTGKMKHELFVYPVQDLSKMLTLQRGGEDVEETDYIKGIVAETGEVDAGKSVSVNGTLTPGFYELACFMPGQNPDGTTFRHFDGAQSVTFAATGSGGPAASILTPSSTISVDMSPGTGDLKDSWLFVPDHLMAKAGDVTFKVTNKMDMEHDFVVYPLGNVSSLIAHRLAGQENYDEIKGEAIIDALAPGKTATATRKLTTGWWAAACFVVSKLPDSTSFVHRDRGQRFTFLVA